MESTGQMRGGTPHRCEVCGKRSRVEPSVPPGDAVCPHCGVLIWPSRTWRKVRILRENDRSRVYLIEHRSTGRRFQWFVSQGRLTEGLADRVLAEAKLLSQVKHDSLVSVRSAGLRGDVLWVLSDHVRGDTLRYWLDLLTTIPLDDAILIAIQCSAALAALHDHRCVHRSVSPDAIRIGDDGRARLVPSGVYETIESTAGLPSDIHMYPQVWWTQPDHLRSRIDVYSLASTFYELVAGRGPFTGDSQLEMMIHARNEEPESLADLVDGVPASLADLLLGALKKDLGDLPDMTTFATQLRAYVPARSTLKFCSIDRGFSPENN